MKKILISITFLGFFLQNNLAQVSDERDPWGNLYTPIVAIQPIINQAGEVGAGVIKKLQNSCFTGFSYAKNVKYIDRTTPDLYNQLRDANVTPQFIMNITLHHFEYLTASVSSKKAIDAKAALTFSLVSLENSAILKQSTVMLYATNDSDFQKQSSIDEDNIKIAIYGQTIKATKNVTNTFFDVVFEVKDMIEVDDDWAEWVALDNQHLEHLSFNDELMSVAVKQQYVNQGITYRWTKNIGIMKQGTHSGKNDLRFFQVLNTADQKVMKKAFKDKNKVFGIRN